MSNPAHNAKGLGERARLAAPNAGAERALPVHLTLGATTALGRFPSIPYELVRSGDLPFGGQPDADAIISPSPGLKLTIYVSRDDKALATAAWLFGSIARLGRIDATMFTPDQIALIGGLKVVDIIEVQGATDFFGHSYFVSNPKVSADMIAMLRYGLQPNDPGRPLEQVAGPFWRVPADSAASPSSLQ